tara:strand:+ start:1472 stop:3193 length:1722 start_codon:yes stop_codon:yes gene_type:complete
MKKFIKQLGLILSSEFKLKFFYLLILMIFASALETLGIASIIPLMAFITDPNNMKEYYIADKFIQIFGDKYLNTNFLLISVLFIFIMKNIYLTFFYLSQSSFVAKLQQQLTSRLYKLYYYRSYKFHLNSNTADLIRNLTSEIESVRNAVQNFLVLITELFIAIIFVIFMFIFNFKATTLILILLIIFFSIYGIIIKKKLKSWGDQRLRYTTKITKYLIQSIDNIKILKLLQKENNLFSIFEKSNYLRAEALRKFLAAQNYPRLFLETFAILSLLFLIFILLSQNNSLDSIVVTLSVFGIIAFRLLPSFSRIISSLQYINYNLVPTRVIYDQLQYENKVDTSNRSKTNDNRNFLFENIIFDDVNFSYNENTKNLNNISFQLNKNDRVGIAGKSGSGKSTLLNLLTLLLKPSSGSISINKKIIDIKLHNQWQTSIGYVTQSILLTDDTILKNVCFGLSDEEIDIKKFRESLKLAEIEEFVYSLKDGHNTNVGEKGLKLSGGQIQRLGIARALYLSPKVLILDEATSSLDIENEKNIMSAIYKLDMIDLIIIVSHRLSTIENCNKKIVLENGKILS